MKIKTYNRIPKKGINLFPPNYEVNDSLENEDAILLRHAIIDESMLPPNLKAIGLCGNTDKNIPLEECSKRGIVVFNAPSANANAVKELVIASLIMSARPIYPAMEWVQTLQESPDLEKVIEKGKSNFIGVELAGKKLGVLGLGPIGIEVANFALHLGMEVYGYDSELSLEAAWSLSKRVNHATKIEDIYKKCDFISLHLNESESTFHLLNEEVIKKMKNGVRIINFASKSLVEGKAMIKAVEKGKVASYVTDFPEAEMLGRKNIVAIPHLGASTPESVEKGTMMVVRELIDYLEDGNITNSVNLPTTMMERGMNARFVFIHKNVLNMIAQITNVFSKRGVNIDNLINKSKNELAVTLVDADCTDADELLNDLRDIHQMLSVHYIP